MQFFIVFLLLLYHYRFCLLLILPYLATTAPGPDDEVVSRVKSYIGKSPLSIITIFNSKEHPLKRSISNAILQTLAHAREFHPASLVAHPRSPTTKSSPTMAGGLLSQTR